jgi:hypothetical protein
VAGLEKRGWVERVPACSVEWDDTTQNATRLAKQRGELVPRVDEADDVPACPLENSTRWGNFPVRGPWRQAGRRVPAGCMMTAASCSGDTGFVR